MGPGLRRELQINKRCGDLTQKSLSIRPSGSGIVIAGTDAANGARHDEILVESGNPAGARRRAGRGAGGEGAAGRAACRSEDRRPLYDDGDEYPDARADEL